MWVIMVTARGDGKKKKKNANRIVAYDHREKMADNDRQLSP